MAIRIDASGDSLKRTANLPDSAAFTACGWAVRVGDTNNFTTLVSLSNSSGAGVYLETDSDGDTLKVYSDGDFTFSSALATLANNVPFFFALVGSSTGAGGLTGYYALQGAASLTSVSHVGFSMTEAELYFGNDFFAEYFNGNLSALKVWDAALTANELLQEMQTIRPQRFANLNLWVPGIDNAAANAVLDYSGNARNLAAGGTLTTEQGPGVPWGGFSQFVSFVSSGVTQFVTLTATATGTASIVRAIGLVRSASSTATASIIRRLSKTVSASSTAAVSLIRSVQKNLSASSSSSATLAAIKVQFKALSATSTATASMIRRTGLVRSASATGTASIARVLAALRTLGATSSATASLVRGIAKTFSANSSATASIATQLISGMIFKTLSATSSATATMVRQIGLVRAASSSATATLVRRVARTLSASSAGSASLTAMKVKLQTVATTSTAVASMVRGVRLVRAAGSTATATIAKRLTLFRTLVASSSVVATMTRAVSGIGQTVLGAARAILKPSDGIRPQAGSRSRPRNIDRRKR